MKSTISIAIYALLFAFSAHAMEAQLSNISVLKAIIESQNKRSFLNSAY